MAGPVQLGFKLILSVLCGGSVYLYMDAKTAADLRSIVSTFASVAGTLLGFVIAALSILTSVVDRRFIAKLRVTGHYDVLLHELYWTAASFLLAMVVSMGALFLPDSKVLVGTSVSTSVMILATLYLIFAGYKFSLVMKHLQ